jgi:hydrogenase expression/formation protein HypE
VTPAGGQSSPILVDDSGAGADSAVILLDHGTGAQLSQELVAEIASILGDVYVGIMEDSAIIPVATGRLAMTTDSFVVDPILFGNGDIGKIAVCGTVNDLAVSGATPRYLSLALILEAGLPMSTLRRVLESVRATALEAGVHIVCGDTKVVRSGEADGIYINTTGIGEFHREPLRMSDVRVGDKVLLSGPIGNHTVHLLSIREGLGFEQRVESDCAPLNHIIADLLNEFPDGVRSIRDVTRGGLNAVLNEYASTLSLSVEVEASAIPVQAETAMAADMLGIDPLNCANEGCVAVFVDPSIADAVVERLRAHPYGSGAATIGELMACEPDQAWLHLTENGSRRRVAPLKGAELPRLC